VNFVSGEKTLNVQMVTLMGKIVAIYNGVSQMQKYENLETG